jgi:hypothetical protein
MATPSTPWEEMVLVDTMRTHARSRITLGRHPARPHWNETSRTRLEGRIMAKVLDATRDGMTWELAADIANYAAMLADNRAGT